MDTYTPVLIAVPPAPRRRRSRWPSRYGRERFMRSVQRLMRISEQGAIRNLLGMFAEGT